MIMESYSHPSASQHSDADLMDVQTMSDGVAWLLFRSDWYLLYAIPKQDVISTAELVAEYALGADDREFSYAAEGCSNSDTLSDFLCRMELKLRCLAMLPHAPQNAKIAAALLYFRYCYDHNEFMELRSLAQLAPSSPGANSAPTQFLQFLCPILIALEQRYDE